MVSGGLQIQQCRLVRFEVEDHPITSHVQSTWQWTKPLLEGGLHHSTEAPQNNRFGADTAKHCVHQTNVVSSPLL